VAWQERLEPAHHRESEIRKHDFSHIPSSKVRKLLPLWYPIFKVDLNS
jgi:hypothetical protein